MKADSVTVELRLSAKADASPKPDDLTIALWPPLEKVSRPGLIPCS